MIDLFDEDPGLRSVECPLCKKDECAANLVCCFICDDLPEFCGDCMTKHLTENHTQAQFMKAQQELLA